jgi:hypothetical protein
MVVSPVAITTIETPANKEKESWRYRPDKKENAVSPSDTMNASARSSEYPLPADPECTGAHSPQL